MDKHFKKKANAVWRKRTDKHFEKQQNAVWRKNEWANISKNRQKQFQEKTNGQTFQKKSKMQF